MSKVFTAIKVISAAGICGIGIGYAILGYDAGGNGFVDPSASSLVQKLLLTVAAPLLSAVVAYKNGDTNITIKHVFTDEKCKEGSARGSEIAMERIRHMV